MSDATRSIWPDYRTVWRWHFYAGLVCLPFVIALSLTGAIYLFKVEYEAWCDQPYDQCAPTTAPLAPQAIAAAAVAATPEGVFSGYELPADTASAVRVLVRHDGRTLRHYVDPTAGTILGTRDDGDRLMRQIFRLHGELMLGDIGSAIVETAASWTIILILTGLFLWWPRQSRGLAGVLYPRLGGGSRVFWRDLHAVSGIWVSAFTLILLVSGLPWSKFWGDYFKQVRQLTGTAVKQQEWANSSSGGNPRRSTGSGEHAGHGGGGRRDRERSAAPVDLKPLDRVVAAVTPLNLPHPVVIAPPSRGATTWSVKSMTPNRPLRVNLEIDGQSGAIVSRVGYAEKHWLDKLVSIGIALHEGRLFGWPNQVLGLLTAGGLVMVCVSAVVLWWRRRDPGTLGAPRGPEVVRSSAFVWGALVFLAISLPLFGATCLIVWLFDRFVRRRIPALHAWLG